jgi:hypothetical protein
MKRVIPMDKNLNPSTNHPIYTEGYFADIEARPIELQGPPRDQGLRQIAILHGKRLRHVAD